MPLSPEELARRRVANQATHYAGKKARARTPVERAAASWDHWRSLVDQLDDEQAAQWAETITAALEAQITQLAKQQEGGPRR
jgi:hypothetical protein